MTAIGGEAVWNLRRDNERRTLASSLRMAEAIEDLAATAGVDGSAVTAAADDVRGDVIERRERIDALSQDALGSLAWMELRNEARQSKQVQTQHVSLLQGALLRHVGAVRDRAVAADRYLTELGRLCGVPWTGVALPGVTDEHERHHGSVRFAFAASGFWDLPVLAHEFGHVVEGAARTTGLDGVEQALSLQAARQPAVGRAPTPGLGGARVPQRRLRRLRRRPGLRLRPAPAAARPVRRSAWSTPVGRTPATDDEPPSRSPRCAGSTSGRGPARSRGIATTLATTWDVDDRRRRP